jgi:hypothetical protein
VWVVGKVTPVDEKNTYFYGVFALLGTLPTSVSLAK